MSPDLIYIKALHRSKLHYPSSSPWQTKHKQRSNGLMMMRRFSALKQLFPWTWLSWVVHEGYWIKRFMEQSTLYQSSFKQTTIGNIYKHKQTASVRTTLPCSLSSLSETITGASFFLTKAKCSRNTCTYCNVEIFAFCRSSKTAHLR